MGDVNKVTLGVGTLYLNNVDVGFLKGVVEFTYSRDRVDFKPSNEMGAVKQFVTGESAELRATTAEFKSANLRLAMGINEAVGASQSYPEYDPSSYSPGATDSFDILHFGGSKVTSEMSLRFEHDRPDGNKVIIVLYSAVANTEITIPFNEEEVCLHDIAFKALHQTARTAGDQLGFIADQVQ